jgi:Bardet-Biedl syndrome 2 protein
MLFNCFCCLIAWFTGKLGKADAEYNPDLLFVGTQSNLSAYDVERNSDKFFVDVQDGVNSIVVGKLGNRPENMVIAGGNCSLLGFDAKGDEVFWSVTGDNVSSMALCEMHEQNQPQLFVGSDDFEIRIFKNEEMIGEITEAERVTMLHPIGEGKYAYGLDNGTVGVYDDKTRLWRVKTKHRPTAIFAYDIDMDGVPEIISGWSNGSFNVRRLHNGEVIFRELLDAPIAAIVKSDYRMDGKEELIIVSEAGTIYGYLPTESEFGALLDSGIAKEAAADQKMLEDLQNEKLELIAEMKLIDKTLKASRSVDIPVGALPGSTALTYRILPDVDLKAVALRVDVNTDVQIVNLIAVDLGE